MTIREGYKYAIAVCIWLAVVAWVAGMQGCTTAPVANPEPIVVVSPSPSPVASTNLDQKVVATPVFDKIIVASACTSYRWKDRGRAPIGYVKGVAQVFARQVCAKPTLLPLGGSDKDALALYGKDVNLVNTYALLLGLGMRESSGNYSEGADKSAGPETASEAESGAFQFSFNSIGASSALRPLYELYKSGGKECLLSVFQEGASAHMQPVVGVGPGAEFQSFTRRCPAFQVEYAATLIRVLRKHFGPLNRQEAEFRPECQQMFSDIEKSVSCK